MFWIHMLGPATVPRTHDGRGAAESGGGSARQGTPRPARAHPRATRARGEPSSGLREPSRTRRNGRDRGHGGGALRCHGDDAGRVLRAVRPGAQAARAGAAAADLTTLDPLVLAVLPASCGAPVAKPPLVAAKAP